MTKEIDDLASRWIEHVTAVPTREFRKYWSMRRSPVDEVMNLCRDEPDAGRAFIVSALHQIGDDWVLELLGAGAIEDLFSSREEALAYFKAFDLNQGRVHAAVGAAWLPQKKAETRA